MHLLCEKVNKGNKREGARSKEHSSPKPCFAANMFGSPTVSTYLKTTTDGVQEVAPKHFALGTHTVPSRSPFPIGRKITITAQ